MFNVRVPVISGTAGTLNDGVFLGQVKQSPLVKLVRNMEIGTILHVIRKDTSGSSYSFIDISAEASSESAESFHPFGDNSTFTGDDTLYVAHDGSEPLSSLYFDIDVPGVWDGTGIEIWDSTDGITANRKRTIVTDATDGFRAVDGIHRIHVEDETVPAAAFSPVPGDIASRTWAIIKLIDVTSTTIAPLCRRMWYEHNHSDGSSPQWVDFTSEVSGTDANYVYAGMIAFPTLGNNETIAFSNITYGMDITIDRAFPSDAYSLHMEYLASDNTWKHLEHTDGGDDYTNGPATLADPRENFTMRWVPPTDWVNKTLSFDILGSGVEEVTGYFVRHVVNSDVNYGPRPMPLVRLRSKSFGIDTTEGVKVYTATNFSGVNISSIGTMTADTTLTLVNLVTGDSREVVIPLDAELPYNVDITTLNLKVGEYFGMNWISGGMMTDVQINIMEI